MRSSSSKSGTSDPARVCRTWVGTAASVVSIVVSSSLACSGGITHGTATDGGPRVDLGGGDSPHTDGPTNEAVTGIVDLPPAPVLRFHLQTPRDENDYPYSPGNTPAEGPAPRSMVYLSATGSADPEGTPVSVFWNVQAPDGSYLTISPGPGAPQASFSPSVTGPHLVTLEVTEATGLRQTGQVTLTLDVRPVPCAADGVGAPCRDGLPLAGATFTAGSPLGVGNDDEFPSHATTIAPFVLDKYEVTVGRFRSFLARYDAVAPPEGAGAHPLIAGSGWRSQWDTSLPSSRDLFKFALSECGGTWTDDVGPSEARPITCVTWFEAFAFCIWDNQRLPTEAEWEYAAAGGDEQRRYPWGDQPPSIDLAAFGCLFDGRPTCSDQDDLPVVGSVIAGAGRWGHLDLSGSVWEWTLDVYGPYAAGPCDNCANVTEAADPIANGGTGSDNTPRVFRGGDFRFDDPSSLRAASRYAFDGSFPDQTRGFRCAHSDSGRN